MQQKYCHSLLAGVVLALAAASAWSADPVGTKAQQQTQTQQQVRDQDMYGYQLMTPQERDAHRAKMRSAKTVEEQERIRAEHHTQMQIRAKERGVTIPDEPPAGHGPGMGMGGGMGPGGGMGGGGRK
ncbi:MAG TPA: hypothetical protein DIC36_10410 [Gammaproteobacteria bacterium]|nr:hypothetical protein [Gammaproteobacteria bacterium]